MSYFVSPRAKIYLNLKWHSVKRLITESYKQFLMFQVILALPQSDNMSKSITKSVS